MQNKKTKNKDKSLNINNLLQKYKILKKLIQNRLKEFKNTGVADYFYELVYCLLTPQTSAVNADKAVNLLRKNNFDKRKINPEPFLYQNDFYIRFHKTKAKHLIDMKNKFPIIIEKLKNSTSSPELRDWLVSNVKGLGYKEASHFLRNIGHIDLAILDRHILKNLVQLDVLKKVPDSMTKKTYFDIEEKLKNFSKGIKIPMDELDLLLWSNETDTILK